MKQFYYTGRQLQNVLLFFLIINFVEGEYKEQLLTAMTDTEYVKGIIIDDRQITTKIMH